MRQLSLRTRLILIGIVLPSFLLTVLLFYLGADFNRSYREARLAPARLAARQVGYTLEQVSPYVASIYDLEGMNGYLDNLVGDEGTITFIAILTENGKAIYHSQPQRAMQVYPDLQGLESGETDRYVAAYNQEFHLVVRSVPMPGNSLQRLYVVVGMPSAALASQRLIFIPLAITLAVFLFIVILFHFAITRWVTTPIAELAEGAARLGAGDLSYRLPDAPGELGFLARTLNNMAERLQGMIASLEERVAERTAALLRRSQQLEAVMMVASESLRSRDVDSLLQTTVRAISNYFGFYHAGIFLLDDMRKWAVLRAASSEGGARMLARAHRLRVGRQGIVGTVAATGKPRIALDVGDDAVWFNNPDLPDTRSEMALPLHDESGEVIGVLDVQSEEPNAFTEEDISILQLLVDQLSIALQNAALIEQTQLALREMELLQRNYMREGWARVISRQRVMAYEYDRVDVRPVLPLPIEAEGLQEVIPSEEGEKPFVIEPMRYRDEAIGLIALSDPHRRWTEEEISLVREVSEQLSIALENARLFEDAQRTARHQALLNAVLKAAATHVDPDEALRDIALILARGLDMAVGVFTCVQPGELDRVRLQSFVSPSEEAMLPSGGIYDLPRDLQIFLSGLQHAESGKLLPLPLDEDIAEQYDLSQVLYITIRTADKLTGFLTLTQRQGLYLLDPDTRDLAQNIASQVTVILENLNLLEESQRRSRELQLLYDISLRFGRELDADVVRRLLVEQMDVLIDADGAAFVTYDPKKEEMHFAPAYGALLHLEGQSFPLGVGQSSPVFQEGRTLLVEDYSTVEVPFAPFESWVGSEIIVPLISPRGVIAALVAVRRQGRPPFTDENLRLTTLLAAQAAVALENARLYQESTRRAEALQQLYQAGLDLVSALDVQRIVEIGAAWAQRLLGVEVAVAYYWDEVKERFIIGAATPPELREQLDGVDLSPRRDGATYRVLESGEPLVISDLTDFNLSVDVTQHGLYSMAAVPLRVRRRTIGVLFALSGHRAFFGDEHLRLLEFLGTQMATAIQNALYLRSAEEARAITERQARYQSSVARATALLTEKGSEAMGEVLGIIAEAMDVPWAYYLEPQRQEDGSMLWVPTHTWAAEGFSVRAVSGWRAEDLPHWSQELLQGRGFVSATISTTPLPERAVFEQTSSKSVLLIAIEMAEGSLPAVMGFTDFVREREWGEDVLNAVHTMALAVSGTLAREHLFRQVQEALSETEVLYQAAQALNVAVTYEDIIDVLRKYTILGKEAHYVVIQLFDHPWSKEQPPKRLLILGVWSRDRRPSPLERSYPITSLALFGRIGTKPLLVIEDIAKMEMPISEKMRDFFRSMDARGALLVPMVVGGQWIGFVSAFYPEPLKLEESAVTRLKTLVAQAAVAVQNRFQLEVTASRARRERLIRQLGERLQRAPDIDSLLAAAAEELGRSLQARYTSVHVFSRQVVDSMEQESSQAVSSGLGETEEPDA